MTLGISSTISREFEPNEKDFIVDSKHKYRQSIIVYTGNTAHMSAVTQMVELNPTLEVD